MKICLQESESVHSSATILNVMSMPWDFSRSEAITNAVKVVISQKHCKLVISYNGMGNHVAFQNSGNITDIE